MASQSDTASTEELRHAPSGSIDGAMTEKVANLTAIGTDAEDEADAADAVTKNADLVVIPQGDGRRNDARQQLSHETNNQKQDPEKQQQHIPQHEETCIHALEEKVDNPIATPKAVLLPRAVTFTSTLTTLTATSSSLGPLRTSPAFEIPESVPPDRVTLVKAEKGDDYTPRGSKLKNNLYPAVGLLELANAGDFAANVWNKYPVPVYATVFMVIGATFAGIMSVFAILDSRRAWRNVKFLRKQQCELRISRDSRVAKSQPTTDLDTLLSVVYRELGTEGINRWGLNMFMGAGAVLICVGTYLAIAGANDAIFLASNLLSGYIGNAPIALFGTINTCWAFYIFCKAQGHINASSRVIPGTRALTLIKRRSRNLQIYVSINGTATLVGGAGSMVTATRWWGYVMLIPVIFSSLFCNYWWRTRAGYTRRDLVPAGLSIMSVDELSTALEFASRAGTKIKEQEKTPLNGFISDPTSLKSVLAFIQEHDLFEPFCERLVKDEALRETVGYPNNPVEIEIDILSLLALPDDKHPEFIQVAQETVRQIGPKHFKYREQYAAELLGTYLVVSKHEAEHREKGRPQSGSQ